MTLGELIAMLETEPHAKRVRLGFTYPHPYRGYYQDLAFVPKENITVSEMLGAARSALGSTYEGWKGGEYTMSEHTDVWLAEVGCCGETIGPRLMALMLKDEVAER